MSTIKNGEVGTLDTMGQVVWDETKDLQYYIDIHGQEEGSEDRRWYMIGQIERNLGDYVETLDRAIRFLWKQQHDLDADALSLLSAEGKIDLLRRLLLEHSNAIPVSHRVEYLGRFEDDLQAYAEAERLRNRVLRRFLLEPSGVWLRELVDADDSIVAACFNLDESMICEHPEFVRLNSLRCGWLQDAVGDWPVRTHYTAHFRQSPA